MSTKKKNCRNFELNDVGTSSRGPFNLITALESKTTLLTVDEVTELLSLSKFTIYRMAPEPTTFVGNRGEPKI